MRATGGQECYSEDRRCGHNYYLNLMDVLHEYCLARLSVAGIGAKPLNQIEKALYT